MIYALVGLVAELQRQNAWLHERVTLNSNTSSMPPSSGGVSSANRARRRASQRKRGTQRGHPGSYRALVDEAQVDQIVGCLAPRLVSAARR